MSDSILSNDTLPAFIEALRLAKGNPESPEAVAWAMTRVILACVTTKAPSTSDVLDLFSACLETVNGERQPQHKRSTLQ